ncbi:MAG: hypothetical protein Q4E63_04570 [Prevotellaceae bacterium]|nr:hypothetical protein [Prevotellaceae bacterium]
MNLDILTDIRRERFGEIANKLMNNYCILKKDSRDNSDVIYRFAEIEFYLYSLDTPDEDIDTYYRDCNCVEWFFHGSGVDIAFKTVRDGDELTQFGGILVRGVEIYKENASGEWELTGVAGGPRVSMYEIFNHSIGMPDVVPIHDTLKNDRKINKTTRIGIKDKALQRFVFADIDWNVPTERIIERKEKDGLYHVRLKKTPRKYNPTV